MFAQLEPVVDHCLVEEEATCWAIRQVI